MASYGAAPDVGEAVILAGVSRFRAAGQGFGGVKGAIDWRTGVFAEIDGGGGQRADEKAEAWVEWVFAQFQGVGTGVVVADEAHEITVNGDNEADAEEDVRANSNADQEVE